MKLKNLPVSISDFKNVINDNYLYVDKTEHIYNLFKKPIQYYFLSRPRRFGKSLLVSTLKELFSGNKELFKNLWIYNSDWDWQEYPVIHIDFSQIPHLNYQELRNGINNVLLEIAQSYDIDFVKYDTPEENFRILVKTLSKINQVVILIDEYDKPIIDHISNVLEAKKQRDILKSFYGIIKGLGEHLRAVFLTGVTKFSQTSVFSGLNNLDDITLDPKACTLLGYTNEELNQYFVPYMEIFAKKYNKSVDNILAQFKDWYNGYRFSRDNIKVYNPFSVLYALDKQYLENYWITSGQPEFLINVLKQKAIDMKLIENPRIYGNNIGTFNLDNINVIFLLFQTGYLTIINHDQELNYYDLDFPNFEVRQAFTNYLIYVMSAYESNDQSNRLNDLKVAINQDNLDNFFQILENILADIPYTLSGKKMQEKDYHMLLQLIFSILSVKASSEVLTNTGRIDLVIETKNCIYIVELKFNKSAQIALDQIKSKKYYNKFLDKNKKIVLVGANFDNLPDRTELAFVYEELNYYKDK